MAQAAEPGKKRPVWGSDWATYPRLAEWQNGGPLSPLAKLLLPLRWFLVFSSFTFPQQLIARANEKEPLEDADFPAVEPRDSAEVLSTRILNEWRKEQDKMDSDAKAGRTPRTPRQSLLWVILRVFGVEYFWATMAALGETVVKILEALLLGAIIRWLMAGQVAVDRTGYLWAGLLSACAIAHGILHHYLFFLSMRCGFRMRIGFISTIYRKALKLSITHTSSTGYVTNLVSNDVQRFEDAGPFAFFILLGPLEAVVSVGIMYSYIGVSSLVGFAILALTIPLQSFFAKRFGALRRATVVERDERIKTTSDALAGMQVVKLYAWEPAMHDRIARLRDAEVGHIRKASVLRALNEAMYIVSPSLTSLATFGTFWALGNTFTPDKVFVTLYLFSSIRLILVSFFAKAVQFLSESNVSVTRIAEFLSLEEMSNLDHDPDADRKRMGEMFPDGVDGKEIVVAVKDATFTWGAEIVADVGKPASGTPDIELARQGTSNSNSSETDSTADDQTTEPSDGIRRRPHGPFKLEGIDLVFPKGSITAVVGPTGSGKSSLLLAILAEMNLKRGSVLISTGSIALAPQLPWIVNGSVQENILFGRPYQQARFDETIRLAAMETDLQLLSNGKDTMIGERGVTLSGGQRARTALARAIYSDAELVLLDDPLSAVDSRVAKHLWETITDLARVRGKTVIIVTHQLQFVKLADRVVIMEHGKVSWQGAWAEIDIDAGSEASGAAVSSSELRKQSFAHVLRQYSKKEHGNDVSVDELGEEETEGSTANSEEVEEKAPVAEEKTQTLAPAEKDKDGGDNNNNVAKAFIVEERQLGDLDNRVYIAWFKAAGGFALSFLFLVLLCLGEANLVLCDWWLSVWSRQGPATQRDSLYIAVFGALTASNIAIAVIRALMFFSMSLTASTKLFKDMLGSILRAPIYFFQINPLGRLLNRFSKDLALIDELLPMVFYDFLQSVFLIFGILILSACVMPISLAFIPFLLFGFFVLRRYYVRASQQIKRLEANSRSPVYSAIPATLEGLPVIRAFRASQRFVDTFAALQDFNSTEWYGFISSARWLGFRLDMGGAAMLTFVVFLCAGLASSMSGATVGLLLAYVLQMIGSLQWAVRQSVEVQNLMVSVERILDYTTRVPQEPPAVTDVRPSKNWPAKGDIKFDRMSLTYPVTGQTVIKDLSFDIAAGEKVGLVGRTGAGKSSLLTALFRLVDPAPNKSVVIDGVSASDIGLRDLRSALSIVPQEPYLFKGTLREQLDPFVQYDDASIWMALEAVELKAKIEADPAKLDMAVSDGGSNFSVGEKQLLCLARALLKRANVIVMDEVGANIDVRTDRLIQTTLRSATGIFANATVITM